MKHDLQWEQSHSCNVVYLDGLRLEKMARFHMIAGDERECGSVEFSAPDVSQAFIFAYRLAGGCTFELWQEKRKICTIHAGANVVSIGAGRSAP